MFRAVSLTVLITLGLMTGLAFLTNDPPSRLHPTIPAVMKLFDRVAFSGYQEVGPDGSGPLLRRWTEPLTVRLSGIPPGLTAEEWRQEVEQVIGLYDGLPGLTMSVQPPEPWPLGLAQPTTPDHSLSILTLPSDRLVPLFDSGAFERRDPNFPLRRVVDSLADPRNGCVLEGERTATPQHVALTLRGTVSAGARHDCLVEKISLALGFAIASSEGVTLFASGPTETRLNPLARMAMALVYDPSLRPGMRRDEALVVARAVLAAKGVPLE